MDQEDLGTLVNQSCLSQVMGRDPSSVPQLGTSPASCCSRQRWVLGPPVIHKADEVLKIAAA